MQAQFVVETLVHGNTSGELLHSYESLSLWGGVDSTTGLVIDHHHPLCGRSVKGLVLAIPSGRGSCTGSGVMLELLLNGNAPAGLIFSHKELILMLGVLVARVLFKVSIPVVVLSPEDFDAIADYRYVAIDEGIVTAGKDDSLALVSAQGTVPPRITGSVSLTVQDRDILEGNHGAAAQVAMEILIEFAQAQGVTTLLDITRAHIDCCIYIGPACLQFAQKLVSLGARFVVPTTLNSISLDYRRWKELGIAEEVALPAKALADAYMTMGAKMSFTCAPYLLESPPKLGEQIGWAESNAVVFANSVLGARTQKYPDFLDVCIALTGRAPLSGCHVDENRRPKLVIEFPQLSMLDDSAYPVLGYISGSLSGASIPLVCGLEDASPRTADLKAFCAAFATTSSAPLVHIQGVTPESGNFNELKPNILNKTVSFEDLVTSYRRLNTARDLSVSLVSLGNPHFTIEEFGDLASHCENRQKHPLVKMVVTTNRSIQEQAEKAGFLDVLFEFGAEVLTDTCWCMIDEPIIPYDAHNIMTNSAKYAHYAPGMVKRGVHFGSLSHCAEAACTGKVSNILPAWLGGGMM